MDGEYSNSIQESHIVDSGSKANDVTSGSMCMVATASSLLIRDNGRMMSFMESVISLSNQTSYSSNNGNSLSASFHSGEAHGLGIMRDSQNQIVQKGKWRRGEYDVNDTSIDEQELKKLEAISLSYQNQRFETSSEKQTNVQDTSSMINQNKEVPKANQPKLQELEDEQQDSKVTEKPAKTEDPKKKIKKVTVEDKKTKK